MMEDTSLKVPLLPLRHDGPEVDYASLNNNAPKGDHPDTASYEVLLLMEPPFIPDIRCHEAPTIRSKCAGVIHASTGIIYAILASVCVAATGTFVYMISQDLDPYQINVMTALPQLFWASLLMVIWGVAPPANTHQWLWILPGSVLVAATNYLYSLACHYIIMSDVAAITQVDIVFMGILSFLFLRDPFSVVQFLLAILAFAGVVCISKPTFIFGGSLNSGDTQDSGLDAEIGILFALGSALCYAPFFIFARKQGTLGVHPLQSTFVTALTIEVISIVLCSTVGEWRSPTLEDCLYSLGAGVFNFATFFCLYAALARETATLVAIIFTFQMVAAFALQFIVFSVPPQVTSWIGGSLVLIAGIGTLASASIV